MLCDRRHRYYWRASLASARPRPPRRLLRCSSREIDRADEEFNAFLLKMLAENAITVPELGSLRSAVMRVVILAVPIIARSTPARDDAARGYGRGSNARPRGEVSRGSGRVSRKDVIPRTLPSFEL